MYRGGGDGGGFGGALLLLLLFLLLRVLWMLRCGALMSFLAFGGGL